LTIGPRSMPCTAAAPALAAIIMLPPGVSEMFCTEVAAVAAVWEVDVGPAPATGAANPTCSAAAGVDAADEAVVAPGIVAGRDAGDSTVTGTTADALIDGTVAAGATPRGLAALAPNTSTAVTARGAVTGGAVMFVGLIG
jgi:hypothetical protein